MGWGGERGSWGGGLDCKKGKAVAENDEICSMRKLCITASDEKWERRGSKQRKGKGGNEEKKNHV